MEKRRLSAIMFTDIVGYTTRMLTIELHLGNRYIRVKRGLEMKEKLILWVILLLCFSLLSCKKQDAAYYIDQAKSFVESGDTVRAMKNYERALELDYDLAFIILFTELGNWGNAFFDNGEYDQAIFYFNMALEIIPNMPPVLLNRGMTYSVKGEKELAFEDFNRAIEAYTSLPEIHPDLAIVYFHRGAFYADEGDFKLAIAEFSKALEVDTNYAAAYLERGIVYLNESVYDSAIQDFNRLLKINPNDAHAYVFRGEAYLKTGNNEQAIADYTSAIQIDSTDALALNNRAFIYYTIGQYDLALEDATRALDLDSTAAAIYDTRACAYREKGDYEKAIVDHNLAIDYMPGEAVVLINRGDTHKKFGDDYAAQQDFARAAELDNLEAVSKSFTRSVSETIIDEIDMSIWKKESFTISPDSRQIAYVTEKDQKWCVVHNGKSGKEYGMVSMPIFILTVNGWLM